VHKSTMIDLLGMSSTNVEKKHPLDLCMKFSLKKIKINIKKYKYRKIN
jgi:hypothetical protein